MAVAPKCPLFGELTVLQSWLCLFCSSFYGVSSQIPVACTDAVRLQTLTCCPKQFSVPISAGQRCVHYIETCGVLWQSDVLLLYQLDVLLTYLQCSLHAYYFTICHHICSSAVLLWKFMSYGCKAWQLIGCDCSQLLQLCFCSKMPTEAISDHLFSPGGACPQTPSLPYLCMHTCRHLCNAPSENPGYGADKYIQQYMNIFLSLSRTNNYRMNSFQPIFIFNWNLPYTWKW